jgi:putative ABC transport system permease protein
MTDLRYALRSLLKTPSFTAVAVLTLALGIGANAAIFSVVNGVLLRPLPYPESERLVWISEAGRGWSGGPIAYPNFVDWRAQQNVFEDIGVYRASTYIFAGRGEPELLQGAQMTAGVFRALGVRAAAGRFFDDADDRPGAAPVVVLSHAFWHARFAGDPKILNQTLTLSNTARTVIGVMPAGFAFPRDVSVWTPLGPEAATPLYQNRAEHPALFGVARLKSGVAPEQAGAEMDAISARLQQQYPQTNKDLRAHQMSLLDHHVAGVRDTLWMLFGAVGFLLLIACANAANLLLARAAARQREIAVRAALGASRWRIARQLLIESVALALAGAAVGLLLAEWIVQLTLQLAEDTLPRAAEIGIDGRALLFSGAVALVTGVLFGLAPVWHARRLDVQTPLKEAGRGGSRGSARLRHALLVVEVAMTLILLVGAGLLMRSFYRLATVKPGFAHERALTFRLNLYTRKYPLQQQIDFHQRLLERLRGLAGVQGAAIGTQIPLDQYNWGTGFLIDGRPLRPNEVLYMEPHLVSPDYFRVMGIPVVRGRAFTALDNRDHVRGTAREKEWNGALNAIVIDEQSARRLWPDEDPIGKRIRLPWGSPDKQPVVTVVGVVGRVRLDRLSEPYDGRTQAYLSLLQSPRFGTTYVVKTTGEPEALLAAARRQVFELDPEQPVYDVGTLGELRDRSLAPQRLNLGLLGVFAALAVALAAVGLYGVLAYMVTQRRREIGVRMALGARGRDVLTLVVGQGLRLAIVGAAIGVMGALALTGVLRSFLYEVEPADPLTFAGVGVLLGVVVLLASYIPARRASRVDPVIALRAE